MTQTSKNDKNLEKHRVLEKKSIDLHSVRNFSIIFAQVLST